MNHQIRATLPMETPQPYTNAELLALRDSLETALYEREAVLGRAVIETCGSVAARKENPNDIDLLVRIEKSLLEAKVQAAVEEAIRVVVLKSCFDRQNARLICKSGIWQWPLDVGVSDGTKCLWLKAAKPGTNEISFMLLDDRARTSVIKEGQ